jgi:hypothetical protein
MRIHAYMPFDMRTQPGRGISMGAQAMQTILVLRVERFALCKSVVKAATTLHSDLFPVHAGYWRCQIHHPSPAEKGAGALQPDLYVTTPGGSSTPARGRCAEGAEGKGAILTLKGCLTCDFLLHLLDTVYIILSNNRKTKPSFEP